MKFIDSFLNSITMYRLALYGLIFNFLISIILSLFGLLPWGAPQLIGSAATLIVTCAVTNWILSKIFRAFPGTESTYITALILYFILIPVTQLGDFYTLLLAGSIASASKYILAIHKKHLFNPAAITLVILGLLGNGAAFWWIATPLLLPSTLIIGLFVTRKIRRFNLLFSFLIPALALVLFNQISAGENFINALILSFTSWPLIFLGTFMLTEPLTTPPRRNHQLAYGLVVGILFGLHFQLGPIFSSPELALVIGNLFAYLIQPRSKIKLFLKEKTQLSDDIYQFVFTPESKLKFEAGQYLEWTLPHNKADQRGNRRYFTIASSPAETEVKLGVRIAPVTTVSSFKNALTNFQKGDQLIVSDLAGDFVLPKDPAVKLVFIAGGIGVTPFRSMIQYLIDINQPRDIILFYNSVTRDGFVYRDIFEKAVQKIGLKTHYILSVNPPSAVWTGKSGFITSQMIIDEVPDYKERRFYLSGPNSMVKNYKKMLRQLGVPRRNIVTDYFPGF